jgi:NAD/NADP transhydrogenase beta subunit
MAIAVFATLFLSKRGYVSLLAIAIGGTIGTLIAKKIKMAALPQLIAAFHSLVGGAAVLVAWITFSSPQTFNIAPPISPPVLLELGLEAIIGAITFTGSIVAFCKLQGIFPKKSFFNFISSNKKSDTNNKSTSPQNKSIDSNESIDSNKTDDPQPASNLFTTVAQYISKLRRKLIDAHPFVKHLIGDGSSMLTIALGLGCLLLLLLFVLTQSFFVFLQLVILSLILGIYLIAPIGGSDMPVVVSLLNSYSGWATAATGFTLSNHLLIITGALVGSSGAILSYVMCKNMNRSIWNVVFARTTHSDAPSSTCSSARAKVSSPEDAAFILNNASSVIVVPGYGMAVAQAQRSLCDVVSMLTSRGVRVRYAIHPVAGRMPGHMNVLLAEANVSYDDVFELDDINGDFAGTDVALVIGANDITNPAAYEDAQSPIYGMPVLRVDKAGTVLFVKRSLGSGYAGIDNKLFYRDNTMMVIGDAKKVCDELAKSLKAL